MDFLKKLNDPSYEYRAVPFWSWNEELEEEELCEQIREMKKVGIGGAFMHARGGLTTEYMGKKWFNCIRACIDEGKKQNMAMWSYDENGWPSGFAGGLITDMGDEYHVRFLVAGWTEEAVPNALGYYDVKDKICTFLGSDFDEAKKHIKDGEKLYFVRHEKNRYYVDILNPKVVKAFIDSTYEKYAEELGDALGTGMPGFFTDEPQYSVWKIPYSYYIPEFFTKKYGYDPISQLPCMFLDVEGTDKFRFDYWKVVSELYTTSYAKQIYDWCNEHNCKFTGHSMAEDTLNVQMRCSAGAMPMYEYMHVPGMDWLCRCISSPIIPKQVASVAQQLGKKFVLTETFAMCGWDVSLEELKWIAEWQYINGVNFMCQHLESYTIKGCRKRDYPPSVFIQSPWWDDYKSFNDYFARLGKILADGKDETDVLMIHPLHSAWAVCAAAEGDNSRIEKLDRDFEECVRTLANVHVDFHFGDEGIIANHGKVEGNVFKVGNCSYKAVVLPCCLTLDEKTYQMLLEFAENGGKIVCRGAKPSLIDGKADERIEKLNSMLTDFPPDSERICRLFTSIGVKNVSILTKEGESTSVFHCKRSFDDKNVYFFANQNKENAFDVNIQIPEGGNCALYDALNNKYLPVRYSKPYIKLHFEPMQSYIVVTNTNAGEYVPQNKTYVALGDDWQVSKCSPNALTLDFARYKVGDGEWGEPVAAPEITEELLKKQATGDIGLKYTFFVDKNADMTKIKNLRLVCEYTDFKILCNGKEVKWDTESWYLDRRFRSIDINGLVVRGENSIEFYGDFYQNPEVYKVLFGEDVLETVKNKLTYDTEIESVYIIGDFSVKTGDFTYDKRRAMFTEANFEISEPNKEIKGGNIVCNGYPFFSGRITLMQNITVDGSNTRKYVKINKPGAALCKFYVNGKEVKTMLWADYEADITDFVVEGENTFEVELVVSNRNLLGPHHHPEGESYMVMPHSFTPHGNYSEDNWRGRYCFVSEGII